MQTIQIDLQDELYDGLKQQGINIKAEIKEYLSFLISDNYPSIDTNEATKRVKSAYDDYQQNTFKNFSIVDDDYWNSLDKISHK